MAKRAQHRDIRRRIRPTGAMAAAGLLLQLGLAGCAADGLETETQAGAAKPPAVAATETTTEIAKAAPVEPEAKPPAPPPDLMGKQRAEIIEILGRPVFSRRDRPALLLRYRQESCILDLFLYPTPGDGGSDQAVEHMEARTVTGEKMAPKGCIAAVIKARFNGQSS